MSELKHARSSALKDLVLVLNDYFSSELISAEFSPDLSACIANYVEVHEKGDDFRGSRKILEELRTLATRSAAGGHQKLPLLLKCLKELKEVLEPADVIDFFEDSVLLPMVNPFSMTRQTVADAKEVLLFCLLPSQHTKEEPRLCAIHYRLFDLYVRKSEDVLQGRVTSNIQNIKFIITNIERVLLDYGAACPKQFFHAVDKYYLVKENRIIAANIMCRFVGAHDQHVYRILETDLFDHILQCLEIDTSTAVVTMSLTLLVMLLPNVCGAISEEVPQLFFILYRTLCWKPAVVGQEMDESDELEEATWPLGHRRESWDVADPSEDTSSRIGAPKIEQMFTFLYGLYPVNFLKFLQSPVDYLESHHMLVSSQEEDRFKNETITLLARHHFNTDILKYTIETELSDTSKWKNFEPCDITTKCTILDSANKYYASKTPERQMEPPSGPLPKPPVSALTKSLDIQAQRNQGFTFGEFNFPLPAPRSRAGSGIAPSSVDEMSTVPSSRAASRIGRNSAYPNGSTETIGFFGVAEPVKPREFAEDHAFSPRSSQVQSETSSSHLDDRKHSQDFGDLPETLASLSLELEMLHAQIQFERLLKRRYLQQIAKIQRKKNYQTTSEMERDQFVEEIATLKAKANELEGENIRMRQTGQQYRAQRAAVEETLYKKIKRFTDERNQLTAKITGLEVELESARKENTKLRRSNQERDNTLIIRSTPQDSDVESSATTTKIELLKAEIAEWKSRVGSQRDLEMRNKQLESVCKQAEMRVQVAEEQNRTLSLRISKLMAANAHATNQTPTTPKLRIVMDKFAKDHEEEINKWSERYNLLLKQYRSLEESYRDLQLLREQERRNFFGRQPPPSTRVQDQSRLLDDGASVDSRAWESSSYAESGRTSPPDSERSRQEGSGDSEGQQHSPPQIRSAGPLSHMEGTNPFAALLPRRGTTSSNKSSEKASKIKPNSEIRIYGRGGAQNMGMKAKKKDKGDLQMG